MLAVRWIVLLGAMSAAGQVAAQQSCADTLTPGFSERLAYRYAPFIWFSPLERYFPTIPFFPAFDTIAQRSEALPGLNDLTRIAEVKDGKASWDALEAAYVQRRRQPPSPPKYSAVFYRIRCLNARESGTVWTFLRNDPQAWRRSEVKGLYDGGLRSAHFMSVEYYFLYVRDIGLQGHPGDVEKVFVLLPVNPTADDAQFDWEGKSGERLSSEILGRIRIVAGAGHGFTTPNNFLVVVESGAQDTPRHPNLLVEFGGHSVAPENSPPDGRFSPGWDINWNINEAVWGVRDAQAVSGSGFLGSYKEWMTLPRTAGNSVHLFPATQVAEAVVDTTGLDSDTTVTKDQRDAIIRQQTRESPERPSAAAVRESKEGYVLLPVAPFQRLFELLSADTTAHDSLAHSGSHQLIVSAVDSIRTLLFPTTGFTGFDRVPVENRDTIIHLMRYWTHPLGSRMGEVPLSRTLVWHDFEYRSSPAQILKRYLYRPTQNSLRNVSDVLALFTYSADFYLGRTGGKQFQIGFIYPPSGTSVVSVPGIVELQVGLYGNKAATFGRNRVSLSLVYDRHYRRFLSWYIKPVSWVRKRRAYESDSTASDVVLGFGGSIMPLLPFADKLPNPWRHIATNLRVRTGFRIDMLGFRPKPQRLEAQISLYAR